MKTWYLLSFLSSHNKTNIQAHSRLSGAYAGRGLGGLKPPPWSFLEQNKLSRVTKIRDSKVKFSKNFACGALVNYLSSTSHRMIFYVNLLMCIKFLAVIYKNIAFQNMGAQAPPWTSRIGGLSPPPWGGLKPPPGTILGTPLDPPSRLDQ